MTARQVLSIGSIALAMLLGCSSGSTGPACSDSKMTEAVLNIAKSDLSRKVGQDIAAKTEMTLTEIKTRGTTAECAAVLTAKYPAETRLPEAKLPITYVADYSSDNGDTVKVRGL